MRVRVDSAEPSEYRSPSFRDSESLAVGQGRRFGVERGRRGPRTAAASSSPAPGDAGGRVGRVPSPVVLAAPAAGAVLGGRGRGRRHEELDAIGNQLNPPVRGARPLAPSIADSRAPAPARAAGAERREGGGRSRSRAMHDITCAECGKTSRVPFKPQSGKPVFCRECYQLKKDDPKEEAVG